MFIKITGREKCVCLFNTAMKTSLLLSASLLVIISCKDAQRTSKRSVFDIIERNKELKTKEEIEKSNTTNYRMVITNRTAVKYDNIRNLFYKNMRKGHQQVLREKRRKEKIKTHFKEEQKRMMRRNITKRKTDLYIKLSFLTKMT